jgi:hypothetical protein
VIRPNADDVLATVIETFDHEIAPHVHDEYAASLCLTVSQLLRSVRARVAHEGTALSEDNRELRELLFSLRGDVPARVAHHIDLALDLAPADQPVDGYRSVVQLQAEAVVLRAALVEVIEAVPEGDQPTHGSIRSYLRRQLERQRPWLVDAFTGPRR